VSHILASTLTVDVFNKLLFSSPPQKGVHCRAVLGNGLPRDGSRLLIEPRVYVSTQWCPFAFGDPVERDSGFVAVFLSELLCLI
jgi:hypothetical protein